MVNQRGFLLVCEFLLLDLDKMHVGSSLSVVVWPLQLSVQISKSITIRPVESSGRAISCPGNCSDEE